MKRRRLNILATICLLVCAAALLLRARSRRVDDTFRWVHTGYTEKTTPMPGGIGEMTERVWMRRTVAIRLGDGKIWLQHASEPIDLPTGPDYEVQSADWRGRFFRETVRPNGWEDRFTATSAAGDHTGRGFLWDERADLVSWNASLVGIARSTLILALVLVTVSRYLQRRKRASGHCLQCGYDLRETPDRCPECGMAHHRC